MSAQQTIRYSEFGEQTRTRWQKLLASSRRDLTTRARTLLQLAIDSYESTGPAVLQVQWLRGCLWICCQQQDLAQLLDCSDRTVRTELERLRELNALLAVPHPSKPNLIAYRVELEKLEALPESFTPDLDEIICAFDESMLESVSGQISGQISGLMNHDHERMNEFIEVSEKSSITHDHDSRSEDSPAGRSFAAISENDVMAIAGYQIPVNGVMRHASLESRRRVQSEYFADAVQAGQADPDELLLFATLFRCAARLSRRPEGDKMRVTTPAAWIRKVWSNRKTQPIKRIISDDSSYARELLQIRAPVPA